MQAGLQIGDLLLALEQSAREPITFGFASGHGQRQTQQWRKLFAQTLDLILACIEHDS